MNRIIVALDVPTEDEAQKIVDSLEDTIDFYKIGLQLLTAAGPNFIKKLIRENKKVFLDLKLHEIPNSVRSATIAAGNLGVSMITVHASGGRKIMEAATNAADSFPELNVMALTVITSLTDHDLHEVGIQATCEEQSIRLSKLAIEAGCDGLVASPLELFALRGFTQGKIIVTPSIRLEDEIGSGGQSRSDTPSSAIKNGTSYIVVGRPITQSADPKLTVAKINSEISKVL